jgi:hypothetical protein
MIHQRCRGSSPSLSRSSPTRPARTSGSAPRIRSPRGRTPYPQSHSKRRLNTSGPGSVIHSPVPRVLSDRRALRRLVGEQTTIDSRRRAGAHIDAIVTGNRRPLRSNHPGPPAGVTPFCMGRAGAAASWPHCQASQSVDARTAPAVFHHVRMRKLWAVMPDHGARRSRPRWRCPSGDRARWLWHLEAGQRPGRELRLRSRSQAGIAGCHQAQGQVFEPRVMAEHEHGVDLGWQAP